MSKIYESASNHPCKQVASYKEFQLNLIKLLHIKICSKQGAKSGYLGFRKSLKGFIETIHRHPNRLTKLFKAFRKQSERRCHTY